MHSRGHDSLHKSARQEPLGSYLQAARILRENFVDGVYPVAPHLAAGQQLRERFSGSRYPWQAAPRRLRDDNLVSSRCRAGTLVDSWSSVNSAGPEVLSAKELPVSSGGVRFEMGSINMAAIDENPSSSTGFANAELRRVCGWINHERRRCRMAIDR